MINYTLCYPSVVFNDLTFTEEEIKKAKFSFRRLFDYKNLKFKEINFENENYGQLLKLIAYGSRNQRTKKWVDFLINEFTKVFHPTYKPSYNLLFTNLTTPLAYVNQEGMKQVISQLKYDKKRYENLEEEEKQDVNYSCLMLQEIFSLKESISIILGKFTEIMDFEAVKTKDAFLNIINVYNYLEKISDIFETFFEVNIINVYLSDFEYLRHSIAHSHLIISKREVHEGHTFSLQEYWKVNYKNKTFERFQEKPSILLLEMLLITTIFTQILVLYQLLFQDKQLKSGVKETKPGSIVNL